MDIIPFLLSEIEAEAETTRKMLAIVPDDNYSWKPHDKSMSMRELVSHIADIPGWIDFMIHTDELDFAKTGFDNYTKAENTEQLLSVFEASYAKGHESLKNTTEAVLQEMWTLRNGDTIYGTDTKYESIRHAIAQNIHHRAQLGVYLRLLNIPIPGSYGPSADELM